MSQEIDLKTEITLRIESERLEIIKEALLNSLVIEIKFVGGENLNPFMSDDEHRELDNIITKHVQDKLVDRYRDKLQIVSDATEKLVENFATQMN